jgi:hypothetical protein
MSEQTAVQNPMLRYADQRNGGYGGSMKQTTTLEQTQRLVHQLSLTDQARLFAYLTPRVVRIVTAERSVEKTEKGTLPPEWQELFRIGDTIAALESQEQETLTAVVTAMRR